MNFEFLQEGSINTEKSNIHELHKKLKECTTKTFKDDHMILLAECCCAFIECILSYYLQHDNFEDSKKLQNNVEEYIRVIKVSNLTLFNKKLFINLCFRKYVKILI